MSPEHKLLDLLDWLGMEKVQKSDELWFQVRGPRGDVLVATSMASEAHQLRSTKAPEGRAPLGVRVWAVSKGGERWGQVVLTDDRDLSGLDKQILDAITEANRWLRTSSPALAVVA